MTVLLLILLLAQRDTFYELYNEGEKAFQSEAYEQAVVDLEKAVAIRAESSPSARMYSMRTMKYHPYAYLAEANFWLGRPERTRYYLELSDKYKEASFLDDRTANRLAVIRKATLGTFDPADLPPSETVDPVEEFTPLLGAMLNENFSAASAYLERMIAESPDDQRLADLQKNLDDFIDARRQERLTLDAFNRKLTTSLDAARRALTDGDDQVALSRYQQVLALDPENQEAKFQEEALWQRIRDKWNEEGRNDDEIEKLERQLEAQQAEFQEQNQALMEETRQSKREANLAQKEIRRLILESEKVPEPEPKLTWNIKSYADRSIWGTSAYFRTIHFKLVHDVGMEWVKLYRKHDKGLIQEWQLDGKRNFSSPYLRRYQFANPDGSIYAVVRDVAGRETIVENTYDFPAGRKPFFRENWFQGTVMTLICMLIAGFFFHKKWRIRKAFRQRFNPYIAGAPVLNESMFYGRGMTLKQILNTLHNNSLMIYGERRIGKTSFLHRLNKELPLLDDPEYHFIPVFVDLQGVKEVDFFHTLEQEIALCLEPMGISLEPAPDPLDSRQFISRLRKYIRALKEQSEKKPKLVLLLDEVDVMNGFSEHTNQQLRSVFMKGFADHIVAVMAGIHINTRWKSEGSPWYNFFEQIELKPFRKNSADELIKNPVEGVYTYTNDAVDRIMEITGGKPYLIQKMCLNLVSHILAENKRKVTRQDVEYVFKGIAKEFYGAVTDG
ncbi:MAG: ATP-binding protein [Acidobacteriota bacterium]|nr:ATP-binding protein [Acidobacteriota bacterium]